MTYITKSRSGAGILVAGLLVSVLALGGCNTNKAKLNPVAGGGGLAGNWVSGDNVFTASFTDGSFVATANDTGSEISRGSYIVSSVSEVKLDWMGNVTGQRNTANCQRPSPDLLSCTDANGRTFTLRKQSVTG